MKQSAQLDQGKLYSLILSRLVAIEVNTHVLRTELAHLKAEITDSDLDDVVADMNETAASELERIQTHLAAEWGMMPEGLSSDRLRKDLGLDDRDSAV